jgi:putative Mn2+ efflux pump MntP
MLALLLVAASVGLSNFAGAIAIGAGGVDLATRLRVGLVFGIFESGMPVVGLLIGDRIAGQLGAATRWLGAALLVGVGLYGVISSLRRGRASEDVAGENARHHTGSGRLLLTGLALSIDNLVVGFAIGTNQTGILVGAAVIGAVSVALALIGLELGARIGSWAPRRGEQIGGVILISVGFAIATGTLS